MQRISYDLHIHSCLSPCGDNDNTPANIVGMAALLGLDAIAVTDHNSCRNLPAAAAAAEAYGVLLVPGMELTTSEEVHVLCYFHDVTTALRFSDYVAAHSLYVENKPDFFGEQILYSPSDEICGYEPRLLHTASEISFDEVYSVLQGFDGCMVPAHINKATTSVLSNLGFLPSDSRFTSAEVHDPADIEALRAQYPYLQRCHILSSSDAHYLQDILEPLRYLHVSERSVDGILAALSAYLSEGEEKL